MFLLRDLKKYFYTHRLFRAHISFIYLKPRMYTHLSSSAAPQIISPSVLDVSYFILFYLIFLYFGN